MSDDPMQVYQAWSDETIRSELMVFKERMYGGAGSDELRAGLFALDFLTRGSALTDTTSMLIDAAVCEAEMRIQLMDAKESSERTTAENRQALLGQLRGLELMMMRIMELVEYGRSRFQTAEELREYLERYPRSAGSTA